ncbi:MAG: hypothetical protein A2V88_01720 [Elusimicrobia bacterium RBG_16_66_12]|nr:MAG: hypothetical protein A2V88_01720 [Elusimicrobia bacterium RBG_16_66_12]
MKLRILAAPLLLAGCSGNATIVAPLADRPLPVSACLVMGDYSPSTAGYVFATRDEFLDSSGTQFRSIKEVGSVGATRTCDLVVKISQPGTFSVRVDLLSPLGEAALFGASASGYGAARKLRHAVAAAVAEGTELHSRILAMKGAAPSPTPRRTAAAPARSTSRQPWPDLSSPIKTDGGERDAAVIVGAENYAFVAKVPGARKNAEDWQAYLTGGLKVPSHRVALLRDNEATLEKIRKYAAAAASQVEPGGTLWFVFIGHGAPSKDGKDGLLVGIDAQQDADGLFARSLARGELLDSLNKGRQARSLVLIDACFSGRSSSGETLVAGLQPLVALREPQGKPDPRMILLTAGRSDQFAGPLPKSSKLRPAFSYLALGALRGWAADEEGKVTADGLVEFSRRALALDKGRTQTPELSGEGSVILSSGRERAPDLAAIDRDADESAPAPEPSSFDQEPSEPSPEPVSKRRRATPTK